MPTPPKTWKSIEAKVASVFGVTRRPLSGGNSGGGRDDIDHPTIFAEVKHRKSMSVISLYNKTKALASREGKTPILALHETRQQGFLIVVHSEHIEQVAKEITTARKKKQWKPAFK